MGRLVITRFNTEEETDDFLADSWQGQLDETVAADLGVEHETRYTAVALDGRYWTYRSDPAFTLILEVAERSHGPAAVAEWLRAEWKSVVRDEATCSRVQIFGRTDPLSYRQLLIAQMNVATTREAEFHDWYNTEHIPQAAGIPGFGTDHRRFELDYKYSGPPSQSPRFMATYEILGDADLEAAINSDEYREWSGDFLARWRDGTSDEVSTICTRAA